MTRAVALLNGVELPALEEGCANKKLLVKADEKTKRFMDAYNSQRMKTDADEKALATADEKIHSLIDSLSTSSAALTDSSKERYVIPPHLHDLQEADLPEEQRGLVVSEIALFRERAAKKEREKMRDERERNLTAFGANRNGPSNGGPAGRAGAPPNAPSGPKERVWGRPSPSTASPQGRQQPFGSGAQGYNKPVGFVRSEEGGDGHMNGHNGDRATSTRPQKTDLEMENERKEIRRRTEEQSFRDRERRYEPRERNRINALENTIRHEQAVRNAQAAARADLKARLAAWDDDDSDETFYTDRLRWRASRRRRLDVEEEADRASRDYEQRQAEYLRQESEQFLEKQLKDMQSLAEEQRKAGLLLDDGAPVKLNVALKLDTTTSHSKSTPDAKPEPKSVMWNNDDDDDDAATRRRKVPLVKLDFSVAEGGTEKVRERLDKIKESISKEPATLFKMSVRWDGMNDILIDRKLEPLIRRKMTDFLGELDDDDLIMFVVEHLKDHRGPAKLVEGLEPVRRPSDSFISITSSLLRLCLY
ncbi:hypothetical protein SISNIDRAFT_454255 [Sistotremastrum niveocremeum HHB9708]|uniref:PWI domain-containing protein n=1 Tax=Sistotremastrum niveocremeum HHB9708 TaxID=1314777 RepID=A0A164V4J6_9AGAM|nr:hypothetical protein SISNIDRAFT_454255 [Sistotremastrum niveocremeum HHB9708]